ncbi:PilZ domain-containing protein [Desulfovibrio sp. OttesenSCG-928-G11]|nr:PilZ domain-containing protein [Desulfovibrio sp. OttesenSCG-928-G11]
MCAAFLSVSTMVRAMFRVVEGPEAPRMYTGSGALPSAVLREEMLASNTRSDALLRFLAEMDRKLDTLLSLMRRESLHDDFPLQGHIVTLSGAGARLESPAELADETFMEVLLLMESGFPNIISLLAAARLSKDERALTGAPNHVYDLDFLILEQDDREHIIRFVFGEERKRIRRNRDED